MKSTWIKYSPHHGGVIRYNGPVWVARFLIWQERWGREFPLIVEQLLRFIFRLVGARWEFGDCHFLDRADWLEDSDFPENYWSEFMSRSDGCLSAALSVALQPLSRPRAQNQATGNIPLSET